MADTKISALTAASAAADANEIPINEAGTTKKLTVAQIITRALASLKASAANAKDTTNVSTLLTPANLLDVGAVRVLWYATGLDMNSTADQALTKNGTFTNWMLIQSAFRFGNASASCASAVGGVYTAASKGGTPVLVATTAFTTMNAASTGQASNPGSAAALNFPLTASALYFSLTTPHGSAATADLYVLGIPLS